MQLQGELDPGQVRIYRNPIQTFRVIMEREGIRGIQSGLGPACVYQFCMNGTRLYTYDIFKPILRSYISQYPATLICGLTSGALGALIASPLGLAKTRLQAHNTKYTGFNDVVGSVYKQDGVKGLWRGAKASALRVAIGSGFQLSTYDLVKPALISTSYFPKDSVYTHFCASFLTSFVVTIFSNPFDVVSTRMFNQKPIPGQPPVYRNIFECMYKTFRIEGPKGLYKGCAENYLRLGPHTILTFVFWEQFKRINRYYFPPESRYKATN
jgi:solute carrier family 25 protein 34/35